MGLFSFFNPAPSTTQGVEEKPTVEDICDHFQWLQSELDRVQSDYDRAAALCAQANQQFTQYRKEITTLRQANINLTARLAARDEQFVELREAQYWLDVEKLKRIHVSKDALAFEEEAVRNGLRLKALEQARCLPMRKSLEEVAQLQPQPFVVMLIDGDAYQFSDDLIKGQRDPGVTIAQSLWIELSKHILISGTIPAESRIVVRIFFNGRSSLGERVAPKAGKYARQYSKMEEAMIRFAETQPLFDFIDCGGENAHLYLSNRDCHAIFLAVCTDNGYARLLERYMARPAATSKIILVEAGAVVDEIANLGFKAVSFSRIFNPTNPATMNVKHKWRTPEIMRSDLDPALSPLRPANLPRELMPPGAQCHQPAPTQNICVPQTQKTYNTRSTSVKKAKAQKSGKKPLPSPPATQTLLPNLPVSIAYLAPSIPTAPAQPTKLFLPTLQRISQSFTGTKTVGRNPKLLRYPVGDRWVVKDRANKTMRSTPRKAMAMAAADFNAVD